MKHYKAISLFFIALLVVIQISAQGIQIPTKAENVLKQKKITDKVEKLLIKRLQEKYVSSHVSLKYLINSKPINTEIAGELKKLKLPGFKDYISAMTKTKNEIRYQESLDKFVNIVAVVSEPFPKSKEDSIRQQIVDLLSLDLKQHDSVHFIKLKAKNPVAKKTQDETKKKEQDLAKKTQDDAKKKAKQLAKKKVKTKLDPKLEAQSSKHLIRAREAYFQNNLDLALSEVIASLSLVPEMEQGYEMLGSIYYRLNWNHLAYKNWKKALELNPTNKKLEKFLAKVKYE